MGDAVFQGGIAPRPADRSRRVEIELGPAGGPRGHVFVCDRGPQDAPVVVLLHGLLVHHHEFARLIPRLERDFRVLAPDLPGCGSSDRPPPEEVDGYSLTWIASALARVLASPELGLGPGRPVHILGHSLGGAVAAILTTILSTRGTGPGEAAPSVASLTLVDSSCFTMPMPLEGRLALMPRVGPLVFTRLYRRVDLHRYFTRVFSRPELVDDEAVKVYWDQLTRAGGREAAYAMLLQLADLDAMSARFCEIRCPSLVVWGELDSLIPLAHGRRLAQLIPGARLEVIEGCGHAPNEEAPAELARLLREHVAGVGPRGLARGF